MRFISLISLFAYSSQFTYVLGWQPSFSYGQYMCLTIESVEGTIEEITFRFNDTGSDDLYSWVWRSDHEQYNEIWVDEQWSNEGWIFWALGNMDTWALGYHGCELEDYVHPVECEWYADGSGFDQVIAAEYCDPTPSPTLDIQWKEDENEVLSRPDRLQAAGFYDGSIFVLGGGENRRQFVQYDTDTNTMTTNVQYDARITTDIVCRGQGYAQNNEWLYIIPNQGTHLAVYNLETGVFAEWNDIPQIFPQKVGYRGCLAFYNDFLFVIGGYDFPGSGGIGILKTTQIFSVAGNGWLDSTPSLNEEAQRMACIVHPKTEILYTFGGRDANNVALSSIELLSVGDMDNIGLYNWETYSNILVPARSGSRAVIWGDDILLIGGRTDISPYYIQQNEIFHTVDNTLELGESMTVGLGDAAVVMAQNNIVYTFGGEALNVSSGARRILDTIQSFDLPTHSPTLEPTTTGSSRLLSMR